MSKVALVAGSDRYQNITKALKKIKPQILSKIKNAKNVVLKPNCIDDEHLLASTNVDALRATLDFLKPFYFHQITLAEGSGVGNTQKAFQNFSYLDLRKNHNLEFVDLNVDTGVPIQIYDRHGSKFTIEIAKTLVDADYIISIGPPKTHDSVIVTLSIKNVAMAAPTMKFAHKYKWSMHQGYVAINKNIAQVAKKVWPSLAIIDGLEGMEGEGPVHGTKVDFGLALASTDPLACDTLCTTLMGFDPTEVGYLVYLTKDKMGEGVLEKIEVIGEKDWQKFIKKFQPHSGYEEQKRWHGNFN